MKPGLFLAATILWSATNMNIKLHPVPLDIAASVTSVQLLNGNGAQLVTASKGSLWLIAQDQPASQARALDLEALPGFAWDSRRAEDGSLTSVYTEPGSAICWVMFRTAGAASGTRIHGETFVVYLQPHFVKGKGSQATAIRLEGGRAQVFLFRNASEPDEMPDPVGEPARSITDARLLPDAADYWLFTLKREPGEGGDAGPRITASGNRMPGILAATRLGKDLKPVGGPVPVFGKLPVYEFDVAAAPDNEIAIFATTPAGAIYARAALKGAPLPEKSWKETAFARPLSSPSLLFDNGTAHCAAIENIETPEAKILRGKIE